MKKYIHPAIIKKDLMRFSPLWGLFTVFMLLFLFLFWESSGSAARFFNNAADVMTAMGFVNFCYAGISALVLFGDLYTARLCNMLHAMPVTRECRFLSHIASGFLFCLIPSVLGTLIAALLLGSYAYGALLWLALMILEYLFFFGVAVFSAMCAGSRLGAGLVYILLNFFAIFLGWMAEIVIPPLLYGIPVVAADLLIFSPMAWLLNGQNFIETHYDNMKSITVLDSIPSGPWIYLGIIAFLGIVLFGLGMLLYKKRHLESAGDLIAFPAIAPIFLTIETLLCGVFFYTLGEVFEISPWFFLFVGLAMGFYVGKMLLEKQVNVFRLKNFLGFGALVVSVVLALFLIKLDVFGAARYIPAATSVESVTLAPHAYTTVFHEETITLKDPADIAAVLDIHKTGIEKRANDDESYNTVWLTYKLKNGKTIERVYRIPATETVTMKTLQSFFSRPEAVLQGLTKEYILSRTIALEVYAYENSSFSSFYFTEEEVDYEIGDKYAVQGINIDNLKEHPFMLGLMDAIYADCQGETLAQRYRADINAIGNIHLELQDHRYINITVYEDNTNILSFLASQSTTQD